MKYTIYYHELNPDKPTYPADSCTSFVSESQEEEDLMSKFFSIKTDEREKEHIFYEIEKRLKECGKLKEHDWIDYIFLNEL